MKRKVGEETIPIYKYFCDTCGKILGKDKDLFIHMNENFLLEVGIGEYRSRGKELNFCSVECLSKYKKWYSGDINILEGYLYMSMPTKFVRKFYNMLEDST